MVDSPDISVVRQRTFLATVGATASMALAGCGSGGSSDGGDNGDGGSGGITVAVGPNGDLSFEPKEVTISTG